ncbi:MAG: exodeoxyribonuclease VII small subunit [Acidobacteria bacterium]|nr:exodeoxyribonuclease VII small subunit [Acidobacteriota bacterium]
MAKTAKTPASKSDETPEPSFGEALEALEGILGRIEGEEIDLDELATELRHGAELLTLCRAKIRRAEIEVTQIVQSLDSSDDETEAGDEA